MSLKLMAVGAHPDDECFAFGGALALAADRGVETYMLCMTDGQAATYRGESTSGEDLGRIRRVEFEESCKVLGVTHAEMLDYQDAKLEFVNFSSAAERLVERMRRFKPDVVVTFGGDGGLNTHNDHMMVSFLTTAAFHWAGRVKRYPEAGEVFQPKRLFYISTNFFIPKRQVPLPAPWNVKLDIESVQKRKAESFGKHVSQGPVMETSRALFERFGHEEFYTLVAGEGVQEMRIMHDMFEGWGV